MKYLYNILLQISEKLLGLFGNFFGQKVRYFKAGQKQVFKRLNACLNPDKKTIWFHVSSLGEYEQALPVIEKIKSQYADYQILLTFFSPSGYEVKKDKTPADCVSYLPVDTRKNVQKFLDLVQPDAVFFVKYDLWPNYLHGLKKRNIPTYLISGLFTKNHPFFKAYNPWLKKSLEAITHFFVQDDNSQKVLNSQGFQQVTVTGDTRFDRVFQIAQTAISYDFVKNFKQDRILLIAGSTWPKDEELLARYINNSPADFKTIIAPHEIDDEHIAGIEKKLQVKTIRYSDIKQNIDLSEYKVLILNTIGMLNQIYKDADIVYIGNGFGKSIHNIQEPAVFGVPIITGPHIDKFKEAVDLKIAGGLISINNYTELKNILDSLIQNPELRQQKAGITKTYALQNVGATDNIMTHLRL